MGECDHLSLCVVISEVIQFSIFWVTVFGFTLHFEPDQALFLSFTCWNLKHFKVQEETIYIQSKYHRIYQHFQFFFPVFVSKLNYILILHITILTIR